jgi:hypothetical protein
MFAVKVYRMAEEVQGINYAEERIFTRKLKGDMAG